MKQQQDANQFNIFLSDDEISLLSRPSGPPQQKNIFIAKGKGRIQGPEINNQFYGKENNNIIKYTALIYAFLSIYSVILGIKAFLEQDQKVIYFYDLPFLGSRYFKVCVATIAFCGLIIVQTIFLAYSNVNSLFIFILFYQKKSETLLVQTEKINQSSIHIGAHIFGIISQFSLLSFGVLPAEMDKLSPLLKFQDSIFLDIYFVTAFLYQSYMMYFSTKNWKQNKYLIYFRTIIYGLICNVFLLCNPYVLFKALDEMKIPYTMKTEKTELFLPYLILLLNGVWFGTLFQKLSQIIIIFKVQQQSDGVRDIF